MKLPKLFSKRSDGKLQELTIEVDGYCYRTISGICGGSMVVSEWTICQGKNMGRTNATTPEQQAESEARSKWKKKYDSGYRESEGDLNAVDLFEPMLAEKMADYPVKQFPVYVQPKLDGARCAGRFNGLWTRKGKPWVAVPHIEREVHRILAEYPNLVLDGELYNHDFHDDFNGIISIIKKLKPTPEDLAESEKYAQYHVYDCQFTDMPDLTFSQRQAKLRAILEDEGLEFIHLVDTRLVNNEEELDAAHEEFMLAGYEGSMVRRDTAYQNKRTKDLLKRKQFLDQEFTIVDVVEGVGNRSGTAGSITLSNGDKPQFNAGIRGNKEYVTKLLRDKRELIGKLATVRYQNLSADGVPRFPVMVAVRDYE